jgi:predicted SAM-dependent methyltransferase
MQYPQVPLSKSILSKSVLMTGGVIAAGIYIGLLLAGSVPGMKTRVAALRAPGIAREYLRTHSVRKLQIGAGDIDYAGWLNSDIDPRPGQVYLDLTKRFPLPDGSFQYIFGEHVIEHLNYDDGLDMLRECYRVLAPGGKIRLATPNLLKYVQLFRDPKTAEIDSYLEGKLGWFAWPRTASRETMILNLEMRSFGHKFVYDPQTLSERLSQAGFRTIAEFPPGESDDPQLRGVEARHYNVPIRPMNDYETMILQAVRP